ncbi:hypothetical protein [Staphylospora marina]|uniref:hypothetical protein n=1 Tax=Staphylospora marina TaxID=2490858 RepID=UPI0013DDA766|nr:hypothetical protein [Staphylospora marina]
MKLPDRLPPEERKRLNRLVREGRITWNQFVNRMRNGWFDQERMLLKSKYQKWLKEHE